MVSYRTYGEEEHTIGVPQHVSLALHLLISVPLVIDAVGYAVKILNERGPGQR